MDGKPPKITRICIFFSGPSSHDQWQYLIFKVFQVAVHHWNRNINLLTDNLPPWCCRVRRDTLLEPDKGAFLLNGSTVCLALLCFSLPRDLSWFMHSEHKLSLQSNWQFSDLFWKGVRWMENLQKLLVSVSSFLDHPVMTNDNILFLRCSKLQYTTGTETLTCWRTTSRLGAVGWEGTLFTGRFREGTAPSVSLLQLLPKFEQVLLFY